MEYLQNSQGLVETCPCAQIEMEFLKVLVFKQRGKPEEYPEKNLPEQKREPTTNSTYMASASMSGFEPGTHW